MGNTVKRITKNTHAITAKGLNFKMACLSDIHWDNPKCDRVKLKAHLEYCRKKDLPIFINGDFFCLMQGRYDPRRSKKDIRPEHNKADYLDAVVLDAVEWWSPYAHLLTVIGYGNHETGIIKNCETDPLQRFVDLLNYKNGSKVHTGGYGGWLVVKSEAGKTLKATIIKYFHGSGGGGVVTKGAINQTRALEMYENMDIFLMGHIHENSSRNDVRESFCYNPGKRAYEIQHKNIHHALLGTYKEEYAEGAFGWHVERGAPIKPTGGRILEINVTREKNSLYTTCDSYKITA